MSKFVGPMADELQKVLPDAVFTAPNGYLYIKGEYIASGLVPYFRGTDREISDYLTERQQAFHEGRQPQCHPRTLALLKGFCNER